MENIYKCQECEEVMEVTCDKDVDHCPCCGMPQSMFPTDEKLPDDVHISADNWNHLNDKNYDGCGATYSVISSSPSEYCPHCNGQWG
ncbi:hypothetical protein D3C87_82760 [compost metagenome]